MNVSPSFRLSLALGLACVLIASGCQDRTTRVPYIFQLSPETGVTAFAPTGRTPVTDPAVPKHLGVITVSIQGFLNDLSRKRRVLATVADVYYVIISVRAADGAEFSKTIEKAAITNGQTTATFAGLAPGDATVTLKAYDTSNRVIGATLQTAGISAGANTAVTLNITLDPTYTGAGGGSSTSSTGSLTANGSISDGPIVSGSPPAPGVGSFQIDYLGWSCLAIDTQGDVWTTRFNEGATQYIVSEHSPSGTLKNTWSYDGALGSAGVGLAVGSDGTFWTIDDNGSVKKFSATGTELAATNLNQFMVATGTAQVAADGALWASAGFEGPISLYRISPDASQVQQVRGVTRDFEFDATGQVWALGENYNATSQTTHYDLHRFSSTGTLLSSHELPLSQEPVRGYSGLALDAAGNLWVSNGDESSVSRFDPQTSSITGRYQVGWEPHEVESDDQGRIWVVHQDGVSRLTADGQVAESHVLKNAYSLQSGVSGLWALSNSNMVHHISH